MNNKTITAIKSLFCISLGSTIITEYFGIGPYTSIKNAIIFVTGEILIVIGGIIIGMER